jgi:methionyl-tRNA formyltransferase
MVDKDVILFLGPSDSPLLDWLKNQGETIIQTSETIESSFIGKNNITFLISYGYRYILSNEVLGKMKLTRSKRRGKFYNNAINLHISYLPWNRGADPNFWSFIDNTPKGVTIHYLDEGIDTGDIIVQKEITLDTNNGTLATTYKTLQLGIQELFKQNRINIKNGKNLRKKQMGKGSFHKIKDKEIFSQLLSK